MSVPVIGIGLKNLLEEGSRLSLVSPIQLLFSQRKEVPGLSTPILFVALSRTNLLKLFHVTFRCGKVSLLLVGSSQVIVDFRDGGPRRFCPFQILNRLFNFIESQAHGSQFMKILRIGPLLSYRLNKNLLCRGHVIMLMEDLAQFKISQCVVGRLFLNALFKIFPGQLVVPLCDIDLTFIEISTGITWGALGQ